MFTISNHFFFTFKKLKNKYFLTWFNFYSKMTKTNYFSFKFFFQNTFFLLYFGWISNGEICLLPNINKHQFHYQIVFQKHYLPNKMKIYTKNVTKHRSTKWSSLYTQVTWICSIGLNTLLSNRLNHSHYQNFLPKPLESLPLSLIIVIIKVSDFRYNNISIGYNTIIVITYVNIKENLIYYKMKK